MLDPIALCKQRWTFGRSDGSILSHRLRLLPSGKVEGSPHLNEARWRLESEGLAFLTEDGRVSTFFDEQRESTGRLPQLAGRYVLAPWLDITHTLTGQLDIKPLNRRLAVLVRTHVVNSKLFSLLDSLAEGYDFDLFVTADETSAPVDIPTVRKLSHSVEMCADIGLARTAPKGALLWYMGDYALYCSYVQIPDYDHYLMVEYDVHFQGNAAMFCSYLMGTLESYIKRFDFIGIETFERDGVWDNYHEAKTHFDQVFGAFFPFILLSRRAVEFLLNERRKSMSMGEPQLFCESWVPSKLHEAGYKIADLNDVVPGSWDKATFRWNDPLRLQTIATTTSRVLSHPVYDEDEFWRRKLRIAWQTDHIPQFIDLLHDEKSDDPNWVELRTELLTIAEQQLKAIAL